MGKPGIATQKRLYAVSGNRCAFRNCPQPLVDHATGKVTARICHIKGNNPGSKRYEPNQSEEERQGFDNLVVMCPIHHDVIDADDVTFTVGVLRAIKAEHEQKCRGQTPAGAKAEQLFLANVAVEVAGGSFILSANQTGGQTAHVIHNNFGTAPDLESAFRKELAGRHLADFEDPKFGETVYHRRLGIEHGTTVERFPTTAVAFAHAPGGVVTAADEPELLRWADVNKLRFEPCTSHPFLPGFIPDRVGSALVWADGRMNRCIHPHRYFSRYLAVERSGWIEYGFEPVSLLKHTPPVYFAMALGHSAGFLGFVLALADARTIDPATISLGFAIRGTKGSELACITDGLTQAHGLSTPPDQDNLLFLRAAEGAAWDVNGVTLAVAEALLDHWGISRPVWLGTPEFDEGSYKATFFRKHFSGW